MRPVLLVPGISNSGPDHWQSRWQALHVDVSRVMQRDWEQPVCDEWADALDEAVQHAREAPILVAHSLGCLVVARWAARSAQRVHAIVLVAVPDPAGPNFPAEASGFMPVADALRERPRVTVVSSIDDPYASEAHTRRCVAAWSAAHVSIGAAGHINAGSGLGDWPAGWAIVEGWRRS